MKKKNIHSAQEGKVKVTAVEPKLILKNKLDQLIGSLYELHCKIFDGVDKNTFVHYVIFPTANYTKIYLFHNLKGELIGYFAFHYFEKKIEQKSVVVLRGEAGILPAYRRRHNVIAVIIKVGLITKLRFLFREIYVLGCFVHPVMYYSAAKNAYRLYPNYRYVTPRRIEKLMLLLAKEFHLQEIDEETPFVRNIGWITKESELDRQRLLKSKKKEIQYYLEQNPNYEKGYGLETFIPLSFINVLLMSYNFIISYFGWNARIYAKT